MIRTLIVDGERAVRRSIRRLLRAEAEVTVVGEFDSGATAVAAIRRLQPELLFLAIGLPDIDGVSVLSEAGAASPAAVVFTSASDRDALRAFQAHATDYLVKPIGEDRFRAALQSAKKSVWEARVETWARHGALRIRGIRSEEYGTDVSTEVGAPGLLVISRPQGRLLLQQQEVSWVGADGDFVEVHVGRAAHAARSTFGRFVAQLDAELFAQIHRSTFVNLLKVREMQRSYRNEYVVILADGTRLKVSRRYHAALESRLASL